jgi:hypothetical protein
MNLQPSIRKGNPRAVEVGIKVLDHVARINGYAAPQKHELTGEDGQAAHSRSAAPSRRPYRRRR